MARRSTSRSTKPRAASSISPPTRPEAKSISRPTKPRAASSISPPTDEPGVVVGVVRAPHGVRGEVRVEPRTDVFAERFREGSRLVCDGIGELTVSAVRGTEAQPIVRFAGYEGRAAAERLRNRALRVARAEARRAAGAAYLWDDLVGMQVVTPDGTSLGTVEDVIRAGETDVLVARDGARETLLPALGSVIREVDLEARRIVAVPQEELA